MDKYDEKLFRLLDNYGKEAAYFAAILSLVKLLFS